MTDAALNQLWLFFILVVWLDCPFKSPQEAKEAFPWVLIFVEKMFYNGF